jgi:putative oxidoreductase
MHHPPAPSWGTRADFGNDGVVFARILHPRYESGAAAFAVALLRAVTGLLIASISLGKFIDHAQEAVDFERYGVPIPDFSVYAVGVIELSCGLLLVIGLLTRPAAAALALTLMGAIGTAGRVEGGSFHLGVGPALLAVMLLLLWVGSGRPAVDPILEARVIRRSAV